MTGLFDIERNPFSCNVSATYYLGNFYFQTSYQTGSLTVQGNHGVIYKDRDFTKLLLDGVGRIGISVLVL